MILDKLIELISNSSEVSTDYLKSIDSKILDDFRKNMEILDWKLFQITARKFHYQQLMII